MNPVRHPWPMRTDYGNALQNLETAFDDPLLRHLQRGEIPPSGLGRDRRPRSFNGQFASVFRLIPGGGSLVALRVFIAPDHAQLAGAHYGELARCLGPSRPACLVPFEYHERGIFVRGRQYPMLIMEWLDGLTLNNWIAGQYENVAALRQLADSWAEVMADLKRAQIVHGDLQHGNIMIVENAIRLVDYDAMWMPTMTSPRAEEAGVPGYQHPQRSNQPPSLHLDDFSAWLIFITFRALAADPTLWIRFNQDRPHENLLFADLDITHPDQSDLWPALDVSPDHDVRRWAAQLRRDIDVPFDQVTPFAVHTLVAPVVVDPFAALRAAWETVPIDWDEVIRLAQTVPRQVTPLELEECLKGVDARVRAETQLRAALDSQPYNPRAVVKTNPDLDLFRGRPECGSLLRRFHSAREHVALLDSFQELWTQQQYDVLDARLNALPSDLRRMREVRELQAKLSTARQRPLAQTALRDALDADPLSDRRLASAYQVYLALSLPSLPPDQEALCLRAVERVRCLDRMRTPPTQAPLDEQDAWWLDRWDEDLLGDCVDAAPYRAAYEEASERLRIWEALRKGLDSRDPVAVWHVASVPPPWLDRYTPALTRGAEIEALARDGGRIDQLIVGANAGDAGRVLRELEKDLSVVERYGTLFGEEERQWFANLVYERWGQIKLEPGIQPIVADYANGWLRLSWGSWDWPLFGRAVRRCRVALSLDDFARTPAEVGRVGTFRPSEKDCPHRVFLVPLPAAREVFVTVWPVLEVPADLFGEGELVGQPLELGIFRPNRRVVRRAVVPRRGVLGLLERWLGLED